ncbi:MAG TPA: hypothetical protein VHZ95_06405, partial [Polyangiales bacterium]|nr:hypothetical protein [Polyangiales bacterium]
MTTKRECEGGLGHSMNARGTRVKFMQRIGLWFLLLAALSGGLVARVHAQQLRPYFLVIVDTSGSMAWCAAGTEAQLGGDDCSCHVDNTKVGGQCSSAFKTNRCGFPS